MGVVYVAARASPSTQKSLRAWLHVISHARQALTCVRQAFLRGDQPVSGKNKTP